MTTDTILNFYPKKYALLLAVFSEKLLAWVQNQLFYGTLCKKGHITGEQKTFDKKVLLENYYQYIDPEFASNRLTLLFVGFSEKLLMYVQNRRFRTIHRVKKALLLEDKGHLGKNTSWKLWPLIRSLTSIQKNMLSSLLFFPKNCLHECKINFIMVRCVKKAILLENKRHSRIGTSWKLWPVLRPWSRTK